MPIREEWVDELKKVMLSYEQSIEKEEESPTSGIGSVGPYGTSLKALLRHVIDGAAGPDSSKTVMFEKDTSKKERFLE